MAHHLGVIAKEPSNRNWFQGKLLSQGCTRKQATRHDSYSFYHVLRTRSINLYRESTLANLRWGVELCRESPAGGTWPMAEPRITWQ